MTTTTIDPQTETTTRIAELTRGVVTLRLSLTDGESWLALDRQNPDGTTATIALPLDDEALLWIRDRAIDLDSRYFLPGHWESLT